TRLRDCFGRPALVTGGSVLIRQAVTDVIGSWCHPAMVPSASVYDSRDTPNPFTGAPDGGQEPVNTMTRNYRPAAMRASDADRDAVVSDLSEHFQAGRLTAGEFDERTGRALTPRAFGELGELLGGLPPGRAAVPRPPSTASPRP